MSHYTIYGAPGSPYSLKVRAGLRAKRVPHIWKILTADIRADVFSNVRAPVISVIETPGGEWVNDSTPFLIGLEGTGRDLLPSHPAARFACLLIEDMGDEWLTKAMFHYRWFYEADAAQLSNWLIFDNFPGASMSDIKTAASTIAERQIGRMPLVGCTPETAPIIEGSADRLMGILNTHATGGDRFLFGGRVSLADLALYGQLWQLRSDPTPDTRMRANFPWLWRWLEHVDDASGYDGEWTAGLSPAVAELLALVGDTYLPFLNANAEAVEYGADSFTVEIDGKPFTQSVFKYQVKCFRALKAEWSSIGGNVRAELTEAIGPNASILD